MQSSRNTFKNGVASTKSLLSVYDYLQLTLHLDEDYISDLLRSQIVYVISSFDQFIHQLVRIGILEIFKNIRVDTDKFKNHPISADSVKHIIASLSSEMPPSSPDSLPENIIDKEITHKLSYMAFQDPNKIKDALSYIWNEPHKMKKLAIKMGITGIDDNAKQKELEQRLKVISVRRNQIVHEADFDIIRGIRRPISKEEVTKTIDFIEKLGDAIYDEVTSSECYNTAI